MLGWRAGLVVAAILGSATACSRADRHAAAPPPPPAKPAPLPPVTHPAPDRADWFTLAPGRLVTAAAERALYEAPGQPHFYLRFRVANRTARPIGIDLRKYFDVLYPNQWGWSPEPTRGVIDERRANPKALTPAEIAALKVDFAAGQLTAIPPGGQVDFYRDFNASGRADVDKAPGKFLLIPLDGQVIASDGDSVEQLRVPDDEAGRLLVIAAPLTWRSIPPGAVTLTDR